MVGIPIFERDFSNEIEFSASRSGGPGGQNVNKVNTKIELRFNIQNSAVLDEKEKAILQEKLSTKINSNGELILISQTERSQLQNKEKVIDKFYLLLMKALTPQKKRIRTSPTLASRQKRLESKHLQSSIKEARKKPPME